MTFIFVPRETAPGETRVAAVPETVKALVKQGHSVQVERGAGQAAGFSDADYESSGAVLCGADARRSADIVFGVVAPDASVAATHKRGSVLVSGLLPGQNLATIAALRDAGASACALEMMPRITRAQKMDILSSQATCAGYQAVLVAAATLPKMFPLLMTAAGTITPARVLVLGVGVAGLQAIATAKRLGAVVEANDIRPACREQVESLGAKFVDTGAPPDAETKGGYAKEASAEFLRKQREILTQHISQADVVITTAQVPGRKAPVLMTAEMVAAMKPGSVIVDMAVSSGGNVEGSVAGRVVDVGGVKIVGEANLAAHTAADASRMYARNVLAFLPEFVTKEGVVKVDLANEIMAAVVVVHDGAVRHAATAQALAPAIQPSAAQSATANAA